MPLGNNVIPNISRYLGELITNDMAETPDHLFEMLGSVFDSFNSIGGGDISQELSQTPFDPVLSLTTNKNFSGCSISRGHFSSLYPTLSYTCGKEGASLIGKGLS